MLERRHDEPGRRPVRDSEARPVLAAGLMILLVVVAVLVVVWRLLLHWDLPVTAGPTAAKDFTPAGPVLQSAPQDERAAYFAEKERQLHGYGWVDRAAGVGHIPIDVAIDLLADDGGAP